MIKNDELEMIERLAKAADEAEKAYPTPGKHPTFEGIEIQNTLDALYKVTTPARVLEIVGELRRARELDGDGEKATEEKN